MSDQSPDAAEAAHLDCASCRSLDALDGVVDGHLFTPTAALKHVRNERTILRRMLRAQDRNADRVTAFAGSLNFVYIHAVGFTLWMLFGAPPLLIHAFIIETVNRLIIVVFKFVPLGAGVNEIGTAFLTGVLGLGTAAGATIGVVRKVRILCWIGVGTILLVRRGLSAGRVLADAQLDSPR